MAHVFPAGWKEVAVTGAALREIETLAVLEKGLPDEYTVYHGVHWTKIDKGYSVYGEVDFIVIAPGGKVLVIEQKSGFLDETVDGLVKKYQGCEKNVRNQLMRAVQGLAGRFGKSKEPVSIDYLLYCPDYRVKNPSLAGLDPSRIVDSNRRDQLTSIILKIVPPAELGTHHDKVVKFFGEILDLVPDASAMVGQAEKMVTRLSGGLATWARQLEFSPYRLRVIGTAGSGKTQLALAEFAAAVHAGKRPLYVCFNRPLADHVQQIVPHGGQVATFHLLADTLMRQRGEVPDYAGKEIWTRLDQVLLEGDLPEDWIHDVVIVDEGQDFSEKWRDAVLRMVKPEGRMIWLEDPMQNLYGRPAVAPDDWVTMRSMMNFRSPRTIVEMLTGLEAAESLGSGIEAASPFAGADVEFLPYAEGSNPDMYEKTKQAITGCLGAGFSRSDIALLSFRGRDKSALLHLDRLGPHGLRSFTGDYDWFGNPVMRDGELLVESVYRFKGQSAPAVIFTEVDFDSLDDRSFRKLFVGMTRARLKLTVVLSERAAATLLRRLD
jgi:hypothetical protein